MRARALVAVMAVLPFMTAFGLAASADEGSPVAPSPVSPPLRPPFGVLRHVDAPIASPVANAPIAMPSRELVVLVGGYQSCACPDDGTFTALKRHLATDPHLDVVRFGADPRYPYDTYGAIEPNATNLRDEIRSLSPNYGGVHIVTHSMGGVVADRAFGLGLSRDDGVLTYVSWSAPHSGSDAARAMTVTQVLTRAGAGAAFREGLLFLQMESDSPAVRDLAGARPVPPPAGVVRLDLREATDVLVTERDARDPGVTSRILDHGFEGHGAILDDSEAIDQTMRTIVERRVPPDQRSLALRVAAQYRAEHIGDAVLLTLCVLTCAVCLSAFVMRSPIVTPLTNVIGSFLPRATRKPCP
jgi:hypothetical protein